MLEQTCINQSVSTRMQPLRDKKDKQKLLIHEIYASIQGESTYMGLPCVFVRTTGCHLRCSYCDTAHAFFQGQEYSVEQVISRVLEYKINLVELTGGEPLLQSLSYVLLDNLVSHNLTVLVETSGAICIRNINKKVKVILDIKTPSSLESGKNNWRNLDNLWPGCEVKFVLSDFDDYDFAKKIISDFDLLDKNPILFSPVATKIDSRKLAEKIVQDKMPVRFQYQLHRVLFGEEPGK